MTTTPTAATPTAAAVIAAATITTRSPKAPARSRAGLHTGSLRRSDIPGFDIPETNVPETNVPGADIPGADVPEPSPVDIDLIALGRGDQVAWTAVVSRYGNLVAGAARSMRLSGADTADVTQNTWLALLENADRIREPGRLPGWLSTVARREALRVLRQASRHVPVSETEYFDRVGEPASPADREVIRAEHRAVLRRAIESLPKRARRLMGVLMADPDATYHELAAHAGIPVGSVGPTRARCIRRLRACL